MEKMPKLDNWRRTPVDPCCNAAARSKLGDDTHHLIAWKEMKRNLIKQKSCNGTPP